jgi:hypothetical protein
MAWVKTREDEEEKWDATSYRDISKSIREIKPLIINQTQM